MFLFFSVMLVYHAVVLPVLSGSQAFSVGTFLISLLGVIFPQLVWWRLRSIHKKVCVYIMKITWGWDDHARHSCVGTAL